jgi:hypothetical protein
MRAVMPTVAASTARATVSSVLADWLSSLPSIERTRSYWSSRRSSSRSSRAVSLASSAPRVAARPSRVAARLPAVAAIPVALASSMAASRKQISCSAPATDRSSRR